MGIKFRNNWRTRISRGPAKPGKGKVVLGIKNGDYRWEFDGELSTRDCRTLMAICATNGKAASLNIGKDLGIEGAFHEKP